jgi:hypothetical protein
VGLAVVRVLKRRRLPVLTPVPFAPIALPQVLAAPERDLPEDEPLVRPDGVASSTREVARN